MIIILKDQPIRPNPFQHGVPDKDWWRLFLKRWEKQLSVHKPQHLRTSRASATTPEAISAWFDRLEDFLSKVDFKDMPSDQLQPHLWNCDETGFCSAQACPRTLAKQGEKDVQDTLVVVEENTTHF